jgi:hypothetical protein
VRDNSRQYLAEINKYLFLKEFFESPGGGPAITKSLAADGLHKQVQKKVERCCWNCAGESRRRKC